MSVETKPEISIIIPVYNAEKYIRECLDSVINQTFKNIEIICVDDGSTDNSLNILKDYAQKDKRIIIKSQINSKVAAARNNGYKSASGKYIYFLDSDDYLYKDTSLEIIYKRLEKEQADVAVWGIIQLIDDKYFVQHHTINKIRAFCKNPKGFNYISLNTSTTYKMFRKSFIDKHHITFPESIPFPEDTIYSLECHFNNPKYVFINDTLHVYRRHSSSTTGKNIGLIKNIHDAIIILEAKDVYKKQPENIKIQVIENWLYSVKYYYQMYSNKHYKYSLKKDLKNIIKYLKNIYDEDFLNKTTSYHEIKKILKNTLAQKIFYVKNQKKHKVINIMGLKIKFKYVKKKKFIQPTNQILKQDFSEIKIDEIPQLKDDSINICFSCNNNFFEYLYICIFSLIKHASKEKLYDIVILEKDIKFSNKILLEKLQTENISIRFYNLNSLVKNLDVNFKTSTNFSIEVYFRFFIPNIFAQYKKVLYMDCDGIFCKDIANIFEEDISNYLLGATRDFAVINQIYSGSNFNYYHNSLKLKNIHNYINSGVLLMNIKNLLNFNFLEKSLNLINNFEALWPDQCIINKIVEDKIKILPSQSNSFSLTTLEENVKNYNIMLPDEILEIYKESQINPIFIHFISRFKPWKYPDIENAPLFWELANETNMTNRILYKNLGVKK